MEYISIIFLLFLSFLVVLAGYFFAPKIKSLFLSSMPEKPTRSKPQVHEVHVIFENRLCTDADDRLDLDRILHSLHSLHIKSDLIMAKQETFDALIVRLAAATNEIAADLQKLRDDLANAPKDTVSDESLATLDSNIAALEAMGQDPTNPVPETPPTEPPAEPEPGQV